MKSHRLFIPFFILSIFLGVHCGGRDGGETPVPSTTQRVQSPVSPVVHEDRRVTFSILAPDVRTMELLIYNSPDTLAMNRDANGIWSITVGPLEPGVWDYTFMIDGVETIDAANPWLKEKPRTTYSLVEVPADQPMFDSFRDVPARIGDYPHIQIARNRFSPHVSGVHAPGI